MLGRTLAHYEIIELLGAGGMGEVYRAHDTTLKRDVAIKVLPADLAQEPERLARLQREAHLLASLNHPHIASIYSLEEADGVRYLVLELVEGDTLAERLAASGLERGHLTSGQPAGGSPVGRLEVEEALGFAQKIAEALEAAHNKGIIHRDLKPANIKITPDDQVKVLDFGLAKAYVEETPASESSPDLTKSPTMADATKTGMILGTAAYMSPEQARVKPLDKRTDIWSFGCVLFEMLTGQKPFQGSTISDTLAAILRADPEWDALPAATPPSVRTLLRRCLNKDIKRRMHDMGDVWLELEEAPEQAALEKAALDEAVQGRGAGGPAQRWMRALLWAVVAISLILVAWLATRPQPTANTPAVARFDLPTEQLALGTEPSSSIVELSRDGTMMAYVEGEGTLGQIYLRRLDSVEPVAVEGAENARLPFFSPDGQWLGFEAEGQIWKVPVAGGKAWPICTATLVHGAEWLEDDTIVYADPISYEIRRVSAEGGEPETVLAVVDRSQGDMWPLYPEVLPNGSQVVFTIQDGGGVAQRVELLSLETGARKILFQGGSNTRYLPSGHLAYGLDGSLMVVPFDADRGEITGSPVPVLDGLLMGFPWNPTFAHFSVADDGTLAYVSGPPLATTVSLQRVDRKGTATPIGDELDRAQGPRFSLDGRRIIISSQSIESDPRLWIYDLERDTFTPLNIDMGAWWPQWVPDGQSVTFQTLLPDVGISSIFKVPTDGSGYPERLIENLYPQQANDWSPDASTLILQQNDHPDTKWDVMMFRPGEDTEASPLLNSPSMELLAELSPDGHWIAYSSDESGQFEVYVRSFPDLRGKWQISTGGGIEPAWSPDGTELFYRDEMGFRMMVVDIVQGPQFRPGQPRLLFEGRFVQTPWYGRNYDVAPDGESFVMVQQNMAGIESAELRLVLNWIEELR